MYRRFTVTTPHSTPVFTEGAILPRSPKEFKRVSEEVSERGERLEFEDTSTEHAASEFGCDKIALKSALNMDASGLHLSTSLPRYHTPEAAPYCPPKKPLLRSTPEAWWKGSTTLASRRRRKRDSLLSINLTKTIAGMGDALHWKLSVLHRINGIE